MLKHLILIAAALCPCLLSAQEKKADIVKKGLNFGPLPVVAYDADKGFQYGALLNIFDYGDGSFYPNYGSKTYIEASFFTKGSQLYKLMYDNRSLIPGVRWSTALTLNVDKALDFYGFNGYTSYFDYARIDLGNANKKGPQDPANYIYTPFYRDNRVQLLAKSDFIGDITEHLKWEAGLHLGYYRERAIDRQNINRNKPDYNLYPDTEPTLWEQYRRWGLISDSEAEGGFVGSLRLGMVYDSRDKEGAPTRGIWAEAHLTAAPRWLGTSQEHYRYSVTFRQYLPIVSRDVLTFAYRVNYEGTFGSSAPYYVLPHITLMGENSDNDGMGGYRTLRGVLRNRVVGLDMLDYTAELRWRFTRFQLMNQNIAFGLNVFSDGAIVTKGRDMSFRGYAPDEEDYNEYMAKGRGHDSLHATVGVGLRFIMNENFIVAFEYGAPVSRFLPESNPLHGQDGNGAFYINTGYLF